MGLFLGFSPGIKELRVRLEQIGCCQNSKTYSVLMSSLVFGAIRAVTECLVTGIVVTLIGSFSGMGSQMNFQVLKTREGFVTSSML